ncbi:uncharacterized protein LOC129321268 [Prosopis cineraria]|uniref:uncharacterized protein LOC129321268 n=1 Tax=Prosopis cineraria TaxID=364024 RepID=UPI00240FAFDE|nr:uncharacterized protein LOC129321268 [Prosopis cineraria]
MVGPSQPPKSTLKFLCSYGGKILPRYPDGKLRYIGGHTRVLSVDRSIPFSELLVKLGELCGSATVILRCQFPTEDLDALVSISSDEDLANLIEEYDLVAPPSSLKIRAFLSPPKSFQKKTSIPSSSSMLKSSSSSSTSSPSSSPHNSTAGSCGCSTCGCSPRYSVLVTPVVERCVHQMLAPMAYDMRKSAGRNIPLPQYAYPMQGNPRHISVVHSGNHWQ